MAQLIDLGKIRFNWAGTYNSAVEYSYNDLVKYGPNLYAYINTNANTGIAPAETSSYWTLVTEGVAYKGTYTNGALYYKNDIVIDGQNTYVSLVQHTANAAALGNTNLEIIALGQEGLPNQSGKANQVLSTDGTETAWTAAPYLTELHVGNAQGQAALDFENAGELTDVVSIFSGSSSDFTQLSLVNTTNAANSSADFISYTADGNNTDGWIDMGITSNVFDSAIYGITGPHDGYIFMSAPRGTTYEVLKKKIVGSVATITTGAGHGYSIGNEIIVEEVDATFNGKHTITATTATTISFATTASPFSEVNLSPYGSVHKPYGNGNLVFATDGTGKENAIVFAAGGYTSGTSQMTITPNDMVEITIDSASTSASSGALVVAGGAGIGGELYVNDSVNMLSNIYLGTGARAWETSADLTSAHIIASVDSDGAPFAQFAFRNLDSAASTDIQIYNNVGTDASGWLDLGITGSDFEQAEFGITGPNEGYVFFSAPDGVGGQYAGTGNLTFATSDAGDTNAIVFAAGGFTTGRTQMAIYPDVNVHVDIDTPSTSPSTGAFTVIGGVGIQGDVNIAGNITFGGEGTQISTANLAVSAPLIFTGDGSTSSTNDLGIITEGKYTVSNIPVRTVVNKQISSNVATLITSADHKFAVGDSVVIASLDATFNGTYTITTVPSATSFQFAKTNIDVSSARVGDQTFSINNKSIVSNIATLQTTTTHTYIVGNSVVVTGVDSTFNGTYTITAVTSNTFSYAKTYTNVSSASVSPVGTAVVNTSTSTATVSAGRRTRWSALSKRNTDSVWSLISNISTKPETSIDYNQNTYGNGVDIIYDQYKLGGLTIQGSGALYGAPYGSLTFTGDITSTAWTTTGIRHIGSSASTITDSSSSGTVAAAYTNTFGSNVTVAALSATTYTNYANAYFGDVTAGSNVTLTNKWSILTGGAVKVGTGLTVAGTATLQGTLVGGSTSDIAINTNKFTVTASTGATLVAGLLTANAGIAGGSSADIAINTNKFTVTASTGNTSIAGTLGVTGVATFTGGATVTGTLEAQEIREVVSDITLASNVATLDWTAGNVYYIAAAPSANMTFNVTNLPTTAGYMYSINAAVVQGATGYYPATFQIGGVGQTIKWAGGLTPTPTSSAGKIDFFNFTMQRTSGGAWIVYGSASLNF